MSPRSPPSTTRRGLLGLCGAGAVGLAGCGTIGRDCPGPSSAGAPTDWPHRYHDLGNSNAAPERPDSLSERWTVRVGTTLREPVIAEGTVYAVAVPRERPFDSRLLAYDADDGERLWEVPMAGFYRARIAAVVDGTAYVVAAPLDHDERFRLYAVDEDGSVAWTYDAGVITAAAVAGDVVFASVLHGSVVAVDTATGRPCARLHPAGDPVSRWLSDVTPVGRPAFADGTVFAPVARYDTDREDEYFDDRVVALDAAGGTRWASPVVDAMVVEEVAAVGDTVYVPATHRREGAAGPGTASLHAFEVDSGERRWEQPAEAGSISAVAARDDVVVVAGGDVLAFDPATGERRWRSDAFYGPPVIAGDRVYGRRTDGDAVDTVVAADLGTGEPIAAHTFDDQLNRTPVFADGRAFAHTVEYDRSGDGIDHVADRIHALG